MKYKKIILLTIILVSLFAISAVSAADAVGTCDDALLLAQNQDGVGDSQEDVFRDNSSFIDNPNEPPIVEEDEVPEVDTSDDLQTQISNVEEGGVLNLTKDYKYVNGSNEGIQINKAMTIDGNGHTLDGCQASRIFDVTASNVLLKNINFKNCFVGSNVEGGVIKINGNNISIVNSTFMNCHVSAFDGHVSGGIINCMGEKFSIIGSQFINCSASLTSDNTNFEAYISGGIIGVSGINTTISQTSFINCSSSGDLINLIVWIRGNEGGYRLNPEDANFLYESRFINCSAETIFYSLGRSYVTCSTFMDNKGLLIDSERSIISKSKFINSDGGIKIDGSESIISESSFINSTGNVIFLDRCDNNLLINLEFINSYVSSSDSISGGVVHCWGSNSSIINSSFKNCTISSGDYIDGGVVRFWGDGNSLSNLKFMNTSVSSNRYIEGGVISFRGECNSLSNLKFMNTSVSSNDYIDGGVISFRGANNKISKSDFEDSDVSSRDYIMGGVISLEFGDENIVEDSNFVDCRSLASSYVNGGVFAVYGGSCNVTRTNFINCSVPKIGGMELEGGVIYIRGGTYSNITESNFINCSSSLTHCSKEEGFHICGGVICGYWSAYSKISQSSFINCTAQLDSSVHASGGVIYWQGADNMISDSKFENCNLKGTPSSVSTLIETYLVSENMVSDSSFVDCNGYNEIIDAQYKNCNIKNCPTVKIIRLEASNANAVYGSAKTYAIKVFSNYKPADSVSVVVKLNGKAFKTIKTSSNGVATFKITQVPGTYKITISALGKSVSKTITVTKATPKLTAKAKAFKKSVKNKNYVVTLKTNQNKVMKKAKLTLKVNGKTYSATTNAKGQATFKITKLTMKGKFTAVVKFAGNKYYNAKTVNAKITVK